MILKMWSQDLKSESHLVVSDSLGPRGLYSPWKSLGQNTGVGSLSLFQGIFPTQGSNPGLQHMQADSYQLSYQWSSQTCKHAKIWILGSIPILLNSNNGVELMSMWLNKLSRWLQRTLKFENYIRKAISFDYPTNMSTTFNN